ncbi:hypothetical protein J36TS2_39530 [Bacillus paralicheniformis]|nr:hypothetical protein J36TS2_39530 [Bacillus paralicheniformis]
MINKVRSCLFKINRILGDINAIQKGRILNRLYNRLIGKVVSRLFRK